MMPVCRQILVLMMAAGVSNGGGGGGRGGGEAGSSMYTYLITWLARCKIIQIFFFLFHDYKTSYKRFTYTEDRGNTS